MSLVSSGKRFLRFLREVALAASIAAAAMVTPLTSWAAPTVGTASAVQGDVSLITQGASRKARVRGSIQLNDEVLTKEDSTLQIMLLDQTTLTVGENCSMIIDEFIYDPNGSSNSLSATVLTGAFRYMSGQIAKANPQEVNVTTPSSTIGIRGTILEGIVGENAIELARQAGLDITGASFSEASLTILRGPATGSNTLDETGVITITSGGVTTELLEPGYFVFTPGPGLPPIGPLPVTDAMLAFLNSNLRTQPSGPSENPEEIGNAEEESGQDLFESDTDGGAPNDDDGGDDDTGVEDGLLDLEEKEEEDLGGVGGITGGGGT